MRKLPCAPGYFSTGAYRPPQRPSGPAPLFPSRHSVLLPPVPEVLRHLLHRKCNDTCVLTDTALPAPSSHSRSPRRYRLSVPVPSQFFYRGLRHYISFIQMPVSLSIVFITAMHASAPTHALTAGINSGALGVRNAIMLYFTPFLPLRPLSKRIVQGTFFGFFKI